MFTLYHFTLCPFSRKLRVVLEEKKLTYTVKDEPFWERRAEFLAMNTLGQVPVLVAEDGYTLTDSTAICEYLEECHQERPLLAGDAREKAYIRKLMHWFDQGFFRDVTYPLLQQKILCYYGRIGEPNSTIIRQAKTSMSGYLKPLSFFAAQDKWLSGTMFSLADITVAAHLSVIDFLGEMNWQAYPELKNWYALIKSRPSFKPLLNDELRGFTPPLHYANRDF